MGAADSHPKFSLVMELLTGGFGELTCVSKALKLQCVCAHVISVHPSGCFPRDKITVLSPTLDLAHLSSICYERFDRLVVFWGVWEGCSVLLQLRGFENLLGSW